MSFSQDCVSGRLDPDPVLVPEPKKTTPKDCSFNIYRPKLCRSNNISFPQVCGSGSDFRLNTQVRNPSKTCSFNIYRPNLCKSNSIGSGSGFSPRTKKTTKLFYSNIYRP